MCTHTHTRACACTHPLTHMLRMLEWSHAPACVLTIRPSPPRGAGGAPLLPWSVSPCYPSCPRCPVRVSHLRGHNWSLCSFICHHIVNLYLLHFSATVARGLSILLSFSKEPALCFIGFLCRVSVFNSSISVLRFVCFLPHDLGLFCSPFSWWRWRKPSFLTLASGVPHVWLPFPFRRGAASSSLLFLFLKFPFKLKRD